MGPTSEAVTDKTRTLNTEYTNLDSASTQIFELEMELDALHERVQEGWKRKYVRRMSEINCERLVEYNESFVRAATKM